METFDVWDTVITRAVGDPKAVFLRVGRAAAARGLVACAPVVFAWHRAEAERTQIENLGVMALTLRGIYSELCERLGLPSVRGAELEAVEVQVETLLCRPVPGAREMLDGARRRSGRAVFISEMYLPEPVMRGLLNHAGLWREGDSLIVSSTAGKSKADGGLYRHAAERLSLSPSGRVHHGNDLAFDVNSPRAAGWDAVHLPAGNLNRFEECLERHALATAGVSSLFAGASRLARLSGPTGDPYGSAIAAVAAGVAAPLIAGFALWALSAAKRCGVRRLHFISRDGQVILDVARRLERVLGTGIEMSYLYGSRRAWNCASLAAAGLGGLDRLVPAWGVPSVGMFLSQLGVDPAAVSQDLGAAGWPRDRPITAADREAFVAACRAAPVGEAVLAAASLQREAALRYLHQEGISPGSSNWGIVDVGWHGNLQESLGRILSSTGIPEPTGFYVGMLPGAVPCNYGVRRCFLFDSPRKTGGCARIPDRLGHMVEMFCAGDEGVCLGYSGSDPVRPVLREARNEKALAWGTAIVHATVARFADLLATAVAPEDLAAGSSCAVEAVLREFWCHPTPDEARVWGEFPFETNQEGGGEFQIAPRLPLRAALRSLALGRLDVHGECWADGVLQRSSPRFRSLFNASRRVRGLARGLRRRAWRYLPAPRAHR